MMVCGTVISGGVCVCVLEFSSKAEGLSHLLCCQSDLIKVDSDTQDQCFCLSPSVHV